MGEKNIMFLGITLQRECGQIRRIETSEVSFISQGLTLQLSMSGKLLISNLSYFQ